MKARSAIFIGDLLRAADILQADANTVAAIAGLLGLQPVEAPGVVKPRKLPKESRAPSSDGSIQSDATEPPNPLENGTARSAEVAEQLPHLPAGQASAIPSNLRRVETGRRPTDEVGWIRLPDPLQGRATNPDAPSPQLEPLFTPQWMRAILAEALSVAVNQGLLDIEAMVDTAARGQPFVEIRSPLRTLRFGVQVLVDLGEGMLPFAQDAAILQRDVMQIVGEGVQTLNFMSCPSFGAGIGRRPWPRYYPPSPPAPVLVLTDLGVSRTAVSGIQAAVDEWVSFASFLRHWGCPLVAFVPYPRSRVPFRLLQEMTIIQWDRTTSVQTIRRALGRR
jgi:hypothetical protein